MRRKTIGIVLAGILMTGTMMLPISAQAAPSTGSGAPWNGTNTSASTGSLTINKFMRGALTGDHPADGSVQTISGLRTVQGVQYQVQKVTQILTGGSKQAYDLTKYDDWAKLPALVTALNTKPNDAGNYTLDDTALPVQTTPASGVIKFEDLPLALYKITEIVPATNVQSCDSGSTSTCTNPQAVALTAAKPFFATIPMINSTGTAGSQTNNYVWDANVYPKNQEDTITKTPDVSNTFKAGDDITYTLLSTIAGTNASELDSYTIWDDVKTTDFQGLDAATLASRVGVKTWDANGAGAQIAALTNSGDYNISVSPGTTGGGPDNQTNAADGFTRITLTFTSAGIAKIAAARNDASKDARMQVTLRLQTASTIQSTDSAASSATNNAGFNAGAPSVGTAIIKKITDPVTSVFKTVKITKQDGADNTKKLAGAKFLLFTAANKTAADACAKNPAATECGQAVTQIKTKSTSAGTYTAADEVTTGATGEAWLESVVAGTHYLVEKQQPDGYVRMSVAQEVTVGPDGDPTSVDWTVKNIASSGSNNWFKLPATGGGGVLVLGLIGAILITTGCLWFILGRRRSRNT